MVKRVRQCEWGVVVASVLVRLAALRSFGDDPASAHPVVDAHTYWSQAQALMEGKDPFVNGYYQPPAYPWMLAQWGRLNGGELALVDVRVLQLILGVLTTAAIVWLAGQLGRRRGFVWAGVVAGLLHVGYPGVLMFEHDLLTPAVTGLGLCGALVLLWPRGKSGDIKLGSGLVGGALVGVAAAVHPTYLLAAGVLFLWLWALNPTRRSRVRAGLFALGVALPLLPTTVRNWQQFHVVEPVSHNAGINFFIGNNPDWVETSFLRPGLPFRQLALEAEPHRRDAAERNAYWKQRTLAGVRADPVGWIQTLGEKALWSVSNTEIPRNEDYRCRTRAGKPLSWLRIFGVQYGWVAPLGVVGLLGLWRGRGARQARLLLPLWGSLQLPMFIFLVSDRYRMATWPLLCIGAALSIPFLRELGAELKSRRLTRWVLGLPLLVCLLVAAWWPLHWRTRMDESLCRYAEANVAYMDKDYAVAESRYREVLEVWPRDMGAHYWLAHLSALDKNYRAALSHMDVVLEQFPDHFPSLRSYAGWAEREGLIDDAIQAYKRAYAVPGDRTATGAKLVVALLRAGRESEARALLKSDPRLAGQRRVKAALEKRRRPSE